MLSMSVSEAATICGGSVYELNNDSEISRIVIDSRDVLPGDMFAAYRGEKVDGHMYISSALNKGASCVIAEYIPEDVKTGPVIVVDDVQEAVERITCEFRKRLTIPVIGIIGSVGKTTAKEMIWSVLNTKFSTHKTKENLNNLIGVPLSLSAVTSEHEAAVIEMGISHFGEMERLGRMVQPDILVYTLIGHAHLEFLGDLNGVLKAKTELLPYLPENAVIVINGDDPYQRKISFARKIISYGKSSDCDVRAYEISAEDGKMKCIISYNGRNINAVIPSFGDHMIYAALEGAAAGFLLGLSDDEIAEGIADFSTVGRRMAFEDTGYLKLIDDCYNANPDSMRSSIDSLATMDGKKVCILGDMLEMGEESPQMHFDIGRYAKEKKIDVLVACGTFGEKICEGFGEGSRYFRTGKDIIEALETIVSKGDTVLVKASRATRLEEVSDALKLLK